MTYQEIIHMLIASRVACGIALAGGLTLTLWLWRNYRKMPPMTLRKEMLHIGGAVATVAAGALLDGDSWQSVLAVSAIALLGAMGWNSSTALPIVEVAKPAASAVPPEALAELERVMLEVLRSKLAPTAPEPPPPEHVANVAPSPATIITALSSAELTHLAAEARTALAAAISAPDPPSAPPPSVIINVAHDGSEVRLEPVPDKALADTLDESLPPVTLPTGAPKDAP